MHCLLLFFYYRQLRLVQHTYREYKFHFINFEKKNHFDDQQVGFDFLFEKVVKCFPEIISTRTEST
jgi:hypothetical protein